MLRANSIPATTSTWIYSTTARLVSVRNDIHCPRRVDFAGIAEGVVLFPVPNGLPVDAEKTGEVERP